LISALACTTFIADAQNFRAKAAEQSSTPARFGIGRLAQRRGAGVGGESNPEFSSPPF
jgi:hypothetical protein